MFREAGRTRDLERIGLRLLTYPEANVASNHPTAFHFRFPSVLVQRGPSGIVQRGAHIYMATLTVAKVVFVGS